MGIQTISIPHRPIDIFPLDEGSPENSNEQATKMKLNYTLWKYRKSISDVSFHSIYRHIRNFQVIEAAVDFIKLLRYKPLCGYYIHQINRIINIIKEFKGDHYTSYCFGDNFFYLKEWFNNTIDISFEDMNISCPCCYDQILRHIYGNYYMTLPPIEGNRNIVFIIVIYLRKLVKRQYYGKITRFRLQ